MNTTIIVRSISKVTRNFSILSLLSLWIYRELDNLNYKKSKLQKSLDRRDLEVIKILLPRNRSSKILNCYLDIYSENRDIVKLLIIHGADPRVDENKLIYEASEANDKELFELFIHHNSKLTSKTMDYFAMHGNLDLLKMFEQRFKLTNELSSIAAQNNHFDVVDYLLTKGYKHNDTLLYACTEHKTELVRKLLESDVKAQFALDSQIIKNLDIVKMLICNKTSKVSFDYSSLMKKLIKHNRLDIIKIIFDKFMFKVNDLCFLKSIEYKNIEITKFLISTNYISKSLIAQYSRLIENDLTKR